jgi:hypothetical protein
MLVCVGGLLQPEDFGELYRRYPSARHRFEGPLQQAMHEQTDGYNCFLSGLAIPEMEEERSHDAVIFALDLAKSRDPPRFANLACKVFGVGTCPLRDVSWDPRNNFFIEGSLHALYQWRPSPWLLPTEDELASMEALLCQPGDSNTLLPTTDEGIHYFGDMGAQHHARHRRWFFSAVAVAIEYCKFLFLATWQLAFVDGTLTSLVARICNS